MRRVVSRAVFLIIYNLQPVQKSNSYHNNPQSNPQPSLFPINHDHSQLQTILQEHNTTKPCNSHNGAKELVLLKFLNPYNHCFNEKRTTSMGKVIRAPWVPGFLPTLRTVVKKPLRRLPLSAHSNGSIAREPNCK